MLHLGASDLLCSSPCSPTEDSFQNNFRPYATDDEAFSFFHPNPTNHLLGRLEIVCFSGFTSLSCIGGNQEAGDGAGFTWCSISEAFPERLDTSRS